MKKLSLPLNIQNFEKLRKNQCLFVDKTELIYNIICHDSPNIFLSRPRRFGKSLIVSILKEIFSGRKDLFSDLWIEGKIDWRPYPVIHLDMLKLSAADPAELNASLSIMLKRIAAGFNLTLENGPVKSQFNDLLMGTSQKQGSPVVVLVDEYDKPIIDHIGALDIARQNRDILKNLYEALKANEEFIHFVFITGVSKFSKVSVFSGLNNITDISLDPRFATLAGFTEDELQDVFRLHIAASGQDVQKIKNWYNGYSWDGKQFVYNPYSILNYMETNSFQNYWYQSGTPKMLIDVIRSKKFDVSRLENLSVSQDGLNAFDLDRMDVISLLFQTGYLTIKEKSDSGYGPVCRLDYPNREVEDSFLKNLLTQFLGQERSDISPILSQLSTHLASADLPSFISTLKSVISSIPYDSQPKNTEKKPEQGEYYYQTIIYLLLRLAFPGKAHCEEQTGTGRIDLLLEGENAIWIFEFKMGVAETAMAQIVEKRYFEPYLTENKLIRLVGVGINPRTRNIGDYLELTLPVGGDYFSDSLRRLRVKLIPEKTLVRETIVRSAELKGPDGEYWAGENEERLSLEEAELRLEMCRKKGDRKTEAELLRLISRIYKNLGDFEAAFYYLEQSIALSREISS